MKASTIFLAAARATMTAPKVIDWLQDRMSGSTAYSWRGAPFTRPAVAYKPAHPSSSGMSIHLL